MDSIKTLLSYDHETGRITYKDNHHKCGSYADRPDCHDGYSRVTICGKTYKAHRIAWFLYTGSFPPKGLQIDHINGIKTDNRICNLRLVNQSVNMRNKHKAHKNNALGILGVRQKGNKYEVRFLKKYIGIYNTVDEAAKAYQNAKSASKVD